MVNIISYEAFWIGAIIIFAVIEALTSGLVSIWFAGGALAALIFAMLGCEMWLQTSVFFAVSVILLLILRKTAVKSFKNRSEATDIDRIIGKTVTVKDIYDNGDALAVINDVDWKIRSADGSLLSVGATVRVEKIEGVRLIVTSL